MVREAIVAGKFYPSDPDALKTQIRDSFLHDLGPRSVPEIIGNKPFCRAVIVPHAGYVFSGPCAAHAYKEIAESEKPDIFIIIGPSHAGKNTCFSDEDWETPLGTVKVDKQIVSELSQQLNIPIYNEFHYTEHSIEVQLPFLRFVSPDAKIIPLMLSHDVDPLQLAEEFQVLDLPKYTLIISSDFTHFGPNYGYEPFDDPDTDKRRTIDAKAIDLILNGSPEDFLAYLEKTHATICGAYPILFAMSAMKGSVGKLLKYYLSSDLMGDSINSVGYSSILFR